MRQEIYWWTEPHPFEGKVIGRVIRVKAVNHGQTYAMSIAIPYFELLQGYETSIESITFMHNTIQKHVYSCGMPEIACYSSAEQMRG